MLQNATLQEHFKCNISINCRKK